MSYRYGIKLKIKLITIVVMLFVMGAAPCFAENSLHNYAFSGGDGTSKKPFLISNTEDLLNLSEAFTKDTGIRNSNFKLTSDIDLGEKIWMPIGAGFNRFSGVFDGNGKSITIRNMADVKLLGLFGQSDRQSIIKNLTVKGFINKQFNSDGEFNFGLIAARAEGIIENCTTEGNILLTINAIEDISIGGAIGFGSGAFNSIKNGASVKLISTGKNHKHLGGIVGSSRDNTAPLSQVTNTGSIIGNIDGRIVAGGIAGWTGMGSDIYNALNQGDITILVKNLSDERVAAAGIAGEIRDAFIDKALNTGKIISSYTGASNKEEVIAGGIAGISENSKILNAGNEGAVMATGSKILYAAGIVGNVGRQGSIANSYTKGNISGTSDKKNSELYIHGLTGGITTATNFYSGGTVRLKAGNLKEIDGETFTNIRPGESPNTFNYGYWPSGTLPFPLLQKPHPTTSAFNMSNGKLLKIVTIGSSQYDDITDALNAWISTQREDYLKWKGKGTPGFDWVFGYKVPEIIIYKNSVEGKWLNTSDWAYEYMVKADSLGIIPEALLDEDMTKGITRLEFSALAVKLYEYLSEKEVLTNYNSPFKDVDNEYATKAYDLGIVAGVGDGLFTPKAILTREQASTMLTRVYQRVYDKPLETHGFPIFADDELISPWAKESVYFMAENNIINGLGNNTFGPSYKAGESESYGRATREQAIKMAVAMIDKFKR